MDNTAIKQIQDTAAAMALSLTGFSQANQDTPVVALPDNFRVHDLEKYLDQRTRYRAALNTKDVSSFSKYHDKQGMEAPIFVDPDAMKAVAIFNLGDDQCPGHGDDTATLVLEKTAAFKALLALAGQPHHHQRTIAEWVEDWHDHISAYDAEDQLITPSQLSATLRNIDIESARKVNSSEGDFSASRSAMESIEAKSNIGKMPKVIIFDCEPYHGLPQQAFRFRISIITSGDKLAFSVKRIREEADTEETAERFCELLKSSLAANAEIYQGTMKV